MNLFKSEIENDFDVIGFKSKRRNLRVLPQTQKGKVNKTVDKRRNALMPGKRISKNGNVYWEARANRSDSKNSKL